MPLKSPSPTTSAPDFAAEADNQPHLMKRAIIVMMFFGALNVGLAVATLGAEAHPVALRWQMISGLVLFAAGVVAVSSPPSVRIAQGCTLAGLLCIGVLIATAPDNSPGTTPFFFLWPCLFAAYFGTRRFVAAAMGSMVVIATGALMISEFQERKPIAAIGVVSSVGLAMILVSVMRGREARLNARLEEAANTDPLTQLMNRRALTPKLAAAVDAAAAGGDPFAVVLFDLDHFKRFNDLHGHLGGDDALRRMAQILTKASRSTDYVARFGGEEFAVVLPGANTAVARAYAERVVTALRNEPVGEELRLSSSVGVAEYSERFPTDDKLIGAADEALYAAKDAGRARVAWWEDTIKIGDRIDPDPGPAGPGRRTGDGDASAVEFGMPRVFEAEPAASAAELRQAG